MRHITGLSVCYFSCRQQLTNFVAHAALLVETAIVLTSADSVPDVWQNAVVAAGVVGLGASLYLVHMYVTPIKRFMQVSMLCITCCDLLNSVQPCTHSSHGLQGLYGVGAAGAVGLALTQVAISFPFLFSCI